MAALNTSEIKRIENRLFNVPVPEVVADAKHGDHSHFDVINSTVEPEDGALSLAAAPLWGEGAKFGINILDYELKDLRTGEDTDLNQFRSSIPVLMFFEPDCPFCARQIRFLHELVGECSALQPLAIGVNGGPAKLRQELKIIRPDFPAFLANAKLMKDFGEVPGTPIMLLGDSDGNHTCECHSAASAGLRTRDHGPTESCEAAHPPGRFGSIQSLRGRYRPSMSWIQARPSNSSHRVGTCTSANRAAERR